MAAYTIKIKFVSDVLIGVGEGYGTIIDSDCVFDELGLPYIPSKRLKGVLLESGQMLNEVFKGIGLSAIPLSEIFGTVGGVEGNLKLNNFYLEQYDDLVEWLRYLSDRHPNVINKQRIINIYSSLRYSTALDENTGIAKEHSLRVERVINRGNIFTGNVEFDEKYERDVALICMNVRRIGTKRNRGLGEVEIKLLKDGNEIVKPEELSEVLK